MSILNSINSSFCYVSKLGYNTAFYTYSSAFAVGDCALRLPIISKVYDDTKTYFIGKWEQYYQIDQKTLLNFSHLEIDPLVSFYSSRSIHEIKVMGRNIYVPDEHASNLFMCLQTYHFSKSASSLISVLGYLSLAMSMPFDLIPPCFVVLKDWLNHISDFFERQADALTYEQTKIGLSEFIEYLLYEQNLVKSQNKNFLTLFPSSLPLREKRIAALTELYLKYVDKMPPEFEVKTEKMTYKFSSAFTKSIWEIMKTCKRYEFHRGVVGMDLVSINDRIVINFFNGLNHKVYCAGKTIALNPSEINEKNVRDLIVSCLFQNTVDLNFSRLNTHDPLEFKAELNQVANNEDLLEDCFWVNPVDSCPLSSLPEDINHVIYRKLTFTHPLALAWADPQSSIQLTLPKELIQKIGIMFFKVIGYFHPRYTLKTIKEKLEAQRSGQ